MKGTSLVSWRGIPDDEVTLGGFKDLLLKQHVLLLSLGNNVLLADSLHGVICPMIHCGHLRMMGKNVFFQKHVFFFFIKYQSETDKISHQLNTAKPSDSKRDGISLIAAFLIQHRNQILKPQSGAGTDRDRQTDN